MNGFMYGGSKFYELRNLTNEEGILAVSQGNLNIYPIEDMDARFYVCRMDWSRKEPEQLEKEFTAVCDGLKALAEIYRMGEIPFGECPAPETNLYGEVDDAEMEQLLLYLEASPQYLQGEGVGHLLLLNKIYAKEQTKLCDLAFHDFFDVKYFCAGLVFELSEGERRCIESIYGLDLLYDRTSEAEFGEDNGLSGGKVYEIEATAIRKLRHPSRMEKILEFLETPALDERIEKAVQKRRCGKSRCRKSKISIEPDFGGSNKKGLGAITKVWAVMLNQEEVQNYGEE